ncbi:hypothetical protein LXA43DRAFT_984204 [Ganoderma leucocontextum]|nr:hypothetical protein LXA43DRAFT_984204 [Ganoderma leucocontextum]
MTVGDKALPQLSTDKKGSGSLVDTTADVYGDLDKTQNHIHYPNRKWANIRWARAAGLRPPRPRTGLRLLRTGRPLRRTGCQLLLPTSRPLPTGRLLPPAGRTPPPASRAAPARIPLPGRVNAPVSLHGLH